MRNASEEEIAEYIDPVQFYTGAYKYQFLDLSAPNGVSEEVLNDFLEDKGILKGQGNTFIEAAKETVYNMFGIGAYDSSAVASGSQRAYELGWTSVESAVRGGAQWISEHYINSADGKQNTLYKMLWNPDNPTEHHYATDISWAVKQAANIERIFDKFPNISLSYEIPVYSGMIAPALE